MDELAARLIQDISFTGRVGADITPFLVHHGRAATARHCIRVAAKARELALQFGEDEDKAEIAGWLHDASAAIPAEERLDFARRWAVEILPEEQACPLIIHQKLSVEVAHRVFGVTDQAVLSAIGCHTTLKANAAPLDKIVFVADKIEWDQPGTPPYGDELLAALKRSLDEAAWVYINHLWVYRQTMPVVHPWFEAAYRELSARGR